MTVPRYLFTVEVSTSEFCPFYILALQLLYHILYNTFYKWFLGRLYVSQETYLQKANIEFNYNYKVSASLQFFSFEVKGEERGNTLPEV